MFFGTVRQKNFDGKLWYPLLCIKFFDTPNFLKHRRDAHEIFWHCETKNFRRKNVKPTFSSIKLFDTRKFPENRRVPLQSFSFRSCETKSSDKTVKLPPSFAWKFSIPEFFRNTEVFSYEFYRHCETKIFQRSLVYPLLMHKILRYTKFSEIPKCSPRNIFGTVWQKVFDGERDISLSDAYNFSIPEIFWYTEVFPNEIFRYCVTKNFRRRNVIPPSLMHKIFRYPKFSDTPKCSQQSFSVLWDKKIWTKNRDTFCIKYRNRKLS